MRYRALGVTCGVGSMLIGARKAGFDIVGNIEWRKYYHTGTFEHNFPRAFMVHQIDELPEETIESLKGIDLIMGHPECGNYSRLAMATKTSTFAERCAKPSDIPLFAGLVAKLKPNFFVQDNLPRSVLGFSAEDWTTALPDYDLFFEFISNYNYGNVQKNRRRMFVIGARKSFGYVFSAHEKTNNLLVGEVLEGLPFDSDIREFNHIHKSINDKTRMSGFIKGRPLYVKEAIKVLKKCRAHQEPMYWNTNGNRWCKKIGLFKLGLDKHSGVMDGGESHFHPVTCLPLTCRERARIQGCPDSFKFILPLGKECGVEMIKQTGKFMPVQFCEYVSKHIIGFLKKGKQHYQSVRINKGDQFVSDSKKWYCSSVGYSNQEGACKACWMNGGCELKSRKDHPTFRPIIECTPVKSEKFVVEKFSPITMTGPIKKHKGKADPLEVINLKPGKIPGDYHCNCKFCKRYGGLLIRKDGTYYNKFERYTYYSSEERSRDLKKFHIALTPIHVARWCIQNLSKENDWVMDPTIGGGTTAVEAVNHNRKVFGIEIQKSNYDLTLKNLKAARVGKENFVIIRDDAINIALHLKALNKKFSLVINNPPYSGDERNDRLIIRNIGKTYRYDRSVNNLAFLKEGDEYFDSIEKIYSQAIQWLKKGGHFCIGVKDMLRGGKPFLLHYLLGGLLEKYLSFEKMVLLPHYPPTLFMNTYHKRYPQFANTKVPRYQTILVFRKEK
jgi:site-specific DNA-cytosine methylase/DNA modification methylase